VFWDINSPAFIGVAAVEFHVSVYTGKLLIFEFAQKYFRLLSNHGLPMRTREVNQSSTNLLIFTCSSFYIDSCITMFFDVASQFT